MQSVVDTHRNFTSPLNFFQGAYQDPDREKFAHPIQYVQRKVVDQIPETMKKKETLTTRQ